MSHCLSVCGSGALTTTRKSFRGPWIHGIEQIPDQRSSNHSYYGKSHLLSIRGPPKFRQAMAKHIVGADSGSWPSWDGSDLFNELRRFMPYAEVEDYYWHGAWDKKLLAVDLELLAAHRKDAGGPEPPPRKDVPAHEFLGLPQPPPMPPLAASLPPPS